MASDKLSDVVVVGAGQAGLGVSYFLKRAGVEHRVLERGQIAETWRTQRWTSFVLNSTNFVSVVADAPYVGSEPEGFLPLEGTIALFTEFARRNQLPVETGVTVTSLDADGRGYRLTTNGETIFTRNVVIASGCTNRPRVPSIAKLLPSRIPQFHAGEYRDPSMLPDGAILIVGSGASGTQIAEDLIGAQRQVYLATSRVGRTPRRYRGRDISTWNHESGFIYERLETLSDPAMRFASAPLQSGAYGGRSLNLRSLSAQGVTLLGRLARCEGDQVTFADDLQANIRFSDDFAEATKRRIDDYIQRAGLNVTGDVPEWEETVPARLPDPSILSIDAAAISAVVWCTGFDGDFSWVRLPVFDEHGRPRHSGGATALPGIYFTGLPWLSMRGSHLIQGVATDANRLADCICDRLGVTP